MKNTRKALRGCNRFVSPPCLGSFTRILCSLDPRQSPHAKMNKGDHQHSDQLFRCLKQHFIQTSAFGTLLHKKRDCHCPCLKQSPNSQSEINQTLQFCQASSRAVAPRQITNFHSVTKLEILRFRHFSGCVQRSEAALEFKANYCRENCQNPLRLVTIQPE